MSCHCREKIRLVSEPCFNDRPLISDEGLNHLASDYRMWADRTDHKPTRQMTRFAKWVLINRKAFDWLTKNTDGFDYLMSSGQGATWNFPGIESVVTNPSDLQRDRYNRWHMTALIFGTWPDGEPILGPDGVEIGECRHALENPLEQYTCDLSRIKGTDKNTSHFGHFHVQPRK